LVAEMLESRGYKVLNKFWNWYSLTLAHRCTSDKNGIETAQGMFQGFLKARVIALQIAKWGQEEEEVLEDEGSMYSKMAEMDREAPQEY